MTPTKTTLSTRQNKDYSFAKVLNSKQKATLKALAHPLKPIVLIGNNGINENVIKEIQNNLLTHELIKIQLPSNTTAEEKNASIEELKPLLPEHSHIVTKVGRIVVLYLEKAKEDNPKILIKNGAK